MFCAHCIYKFVKCPLNKTKHVIWPDIYFFYFIFMVYVMTCVLFVIESLQLYILIGFLCIMPYLVASTGCKTRKMVQNLQNIGE